MKRDESVLKTSITENEKRLKQEKEEFAEIHGKYAMLKEFTKQHGKRRERERERARERKTKII